MEQNLLLFRNNSGILTEKNARYSKDSKVLINHDLMELAQCYLLNEILKINVKISHFTDIT